MRGCFGKKQFDSKTSAANAAMWVRRESESKVREYRCKNCHKWHLGEQ